MDRRTFLFSGAAAAAGLAGPRTAQAGNAVRIGLLLPLTGSHAGHGRMAHSAAVLAVEELNRRSGRDGRFIIALVEDTRSDAKRFMAGLRRMVLDEKVASVFGLPPDGSRADCRRFLERYDGLLWDPGAYEGGECSKHVIHGGATPHQSLKHLLPWMAEQVGERFVVLSGEDALGRELARVAREGLARMGIKPVMSTSSIGDALRRAALDGADVILSTLVGEETVSLLGAYRAAGIDPGLVPIASPTLTELEAQAAGHGAAGHVAVQPYFASWVSPENWRFLDRMRRRHGARVTPSAVSESLWVQIQLFGSALGHLSDGDVHPFNIREAAKDKGIVAPQGRVRIEAETLHSMLWPKIAVVERSGRFSVVARTRDAVRPLPYWGYAGKLCTDDGVHIVPAENRRSKANNQARNSE